MHKGLRHRARVCGLNKSPPKGSPFTSARKVYLRTSLCLDRNRKVRGRKERDGGWGRKRAEESTQGTSHDWNDRRTETRRTTVSGESVEDPVGDHLSRLPWELCLCRLRDEWTLSRYYPLCTAPLPGSSGTFGRDRTSAEKTLRDFRSHLFPRKVSSSSQKVKYFTKIQPDSELCLFVCCLRPRRLRRSRLDSFAGISARGFPAETHGVGGEGTGGPGRK